MSLSYEEALETLQSMFSGYTPQQLDTLLRHHGGHMEHTVETMLAYVDLSPEEVLEKLEDLPAEGVGGGDDGGSGESADRRRVFDADEELARQLAAEEEQQQQQQQQQHQHQHQHQRGAAAANSARGSHPPHATGRSTYSSGGSGGGGPGLGKALGNMFGGASSGGATFPGQRRPTLPKQSRAAPSSRATDRTPSARVPPSDAFPSSPSNSAAKKGRGTPTLLPDDFLRVPGRKYPASSSSGANAASSSTSSDGAALTDEQLARMLQDELFQEELRNNPEFSHLAGRGHMGFGNGSGRRTGRSTYSGERGSAGSGGVAWNERTDIFDRLAELGDTAKRRFQEFAANWGDPNRQQAQTNSNSASGGADHRYRSNNERRGLLSNDLDMDEEEEELNFVGGGGGGSGEFVELGDVRGSGSKKKD